MREKIRKLNLRLSDLALYLGISRPSLYKYLELYEQNSKKEIPDNARKLFTFIAKRSTVSKEQVMMYIMTELQCNAVNFDNNPIKNYIDTVADNDLKNMFMGAVVSSDTLDSIIPYLTECIRLLTKTNLTEEEIEQVAALVLFKDRVVKNKSASANDVEKTKELLGII